MNESTLTFIDGLLERSKERRRGFFGSWKTTKAEVSEIVLVTYVPELLAEVRRLRAAVGSPGKP